ncbi:MAG: single-stranded-DNA-specific exonuclease RecJ [Bacilli bacterium]|nr:single-stranded-DNA-specific exonuclease RecJ [Bacilli bacterium]MBN2876091.1 single-stranded-DNA-specific exonuclease RecJ [Bacilli bacterium]
MLKPKYRWQTKVKEIVPNDQIFPTLLRNRDIEDFERFFSMGEESLHDPYLLHDMSLAKERILRAIKNKEAIMIYGDYDCDGICSISVLYRTLKQLGAHVHYDLPNRFVDGYGLNMRAVESIKEQGFSLVITVDNGITCNEEVKALKEAGIDTIITDHHEVGEFLPEAYAIIHSHLSDQYPFKDIAGVMVAFKVSQALLGEAAKEYYDLAMIGTIADLMPLRDENQAIVNLGIKCLKKTNNLGLQKLIEFSNLDIINVTAISFKIAPKINSSGRLGKALDAVKLLVTEDHREANDLILKIEKNHSSRKHLTEESFRQCEKLVDPNDKVIVVASDKLHEGVIGICAQKIVEKYQKSTLIITVDSEGIGKGSMRSFGDENILDMLHANQDKLLRYGGHSQAAGLQVDASRIEDLRKGLNSLALEGSTPILEVDMEIDLCGLDIDTIQYIQDRSFFTASFLFNDLIVVQKRILGEKHTKLVVECHGMKFDALHFNSLEYYYSLEKGDKVEIVGGLNVNNYRNNKKIQLMIKDVQCNDIQILNMRECADYEQEKKWIISDYIELNDEILLEQPLSEYLTHNKDKRTIVITPRQLKIDMKKFISKRELGKIYSMLKEIKEFKPELLYRRLEYNPLLLKYAVQIFIDLDLIEKTEDYYQIKENVLKTDLQNSSIYVTLEEIKKLTDLIYYDYDSHIKTYFVNKLEELQ